MKHLTLFVISFLCVANLSLVQFPKRNLPPTQHKITIDTIILKSITFDSDLEPRINSCDIKYSMIKRMTVENVNSGKRLLNTELKTRVFNCIEVITGVSVQLKDSTQLITLMEWHFDSINDAEKVEKALSQLKGGEVWQSIVPMLFKWERSKNKIYVLEYYTKNKNRATIAGNIFECVIKQ